MVERKKILVFCDWFYPGFKAGGPIRSVVNFVENMAADYEIFVITGDRDFRDKEPYPQIITDTWQPYMANARVMYLSPANARIGIIRKLIREVNPDFFYLNSMFSRPFTFLPLYVLLRAGLASKVVLSPRGMLKSSALKFKWFRKKLFLSVFKNLGIARRIRFHATDATEYTDIRKIFGERTNVSNVSNFPTVPPKKLEMPAKRAGELRILYVGRVHPIKGLDYLLDVLAQANGKIELTIAGTLEDISYVNLCKEKVKQLNPNIKVEFAGEQTHAGISALLNRHHLFALPTTGENFGHAIFEALSAGRPVLISDQTPWKNLEDNKAGWDIALENKSEFIMALQSAIDWDDATFQEWATSSALLARNYLERTNTREQYLKLFS